MALAINTGHALYANVVALICVEGGVLKDLKNPARTFTIDSNADYDPITKFGTGTYGEYFRTWVKPGQTQGNGVTFSPALGIDCTTLGNSLFLAVNNIATRTTAAAGAMVGSSSSFYRLTNIGMTSSGAVGPLFGTDAVVVGPAGPTTVYQNGAHSIAVAMPAGNPTASSVAVYVEGALDIQSGVAGNAATTGHVTDRLGGSPGYSGVGADFVYAVWFDKELTAGEVAALDTSLAGNNLFDLVTGAGAPANPAQVAATTADAAFSGGAAVAGATPAQIAGTTADAVFSGSAVAAAPGAGAFTTPEGLENNAGSLWLSQAVYWTWTPLGRVGSMIGKVPVDGTGTTHATTGVLTVSGINTGFGQLDVAVRGTSADLDAVYRCYGTAV